MAEKVYKIIKETNAEDRTLVSSFSPSRLDEFIELSINDMYLGNYALEEGFDTSKDTLKNEDVILKFNLDNYYNKLRFDSMPKCIEKYDYLHIPECLYEKLEIVSYGNPDSLEFKFAANLLSDFRFGKLKTHQVFG